MNNLRYGTSALAMAAVAISVSVSAANGQEVLAPIDVTAIAPGGGAEIPVDKYPGGLSSITSEEIQKAGSNNVQDVLQKKVPGVTLIDAAGNNLRSQLDYRGFGAGSITGFPQGIAVYQNGVRINEVFGDVLNWDLIPSNAIDSLSIQSGNPIYGLNAIGGGANVRMKDGFTFQGVEIDAMAGSYGRRQISTQIGIESGPWAFYFAGEKIDETGWRDFSPADVQRMYADLGAKGSKVEAHFNLTWADSSAGVVAASPEELLDVGYARTFTSPQDTELEVLMPSFNATVDVTDTFKMSGLAYYRRYKSSVVDGNVLEGEECGEVADEAVADGLFPDQLTALNGLDADAVCSEEIEDGQLQALSGSNGVPIDGDDFEEPFGVIDRINQKAESFGFNLQGVEKSDVFGFKNQIVVGTSYDRGNVRYGTSSEFGEIGRRYVVKGSGIILDEPDDFTGRNVDVDTEYFGLYFTDTLDLTDKLALTFGGRYNYATVDLVDLTGEFEGITSSHTFERFNPNVGATYKFSEGLSVYGGYSEANRAPTPAELACANPDNPCPIESFLTDDPPLDQVVSKTFEIGARGMLTSFGASATQTLNWTVGLFRTLNQDDIQFVSSNRTGRGFFLNAGDTLRQGVEVGLDYNNGPLTVYGGYSYIKATYESENEFQSPANPLAVPCSADPDTGCVNVSEGDNLPNIPNHRFKAGFDYFVTPQWKVGADVIGASGQYLLGDQANQLAKTDSYARVDMHTSYDVTENIQFYGFVNNVFDSRYGLFGTLFEADEAPAGPAGLNEFNNPRSIVPSQPVSAYGGMKVRF